LGSKIKIKSTVKLKTLKFSIYLNFNPKFKLSRVKNLIIDTKHDRVPKSDLPGLFKVMSGRMSSFLYYSHD
jgi:hypothetical protein